MNLNTVQSGLSHLIFPNPFPEIELGICQFGTLRVNIIGQGFQVWTYVHLQHGNTVVDVIFSLRTLLCQASCV